MHGAVFEGVVEGQVTIRHGSNLVTGQGKVKYMSGGVYEGSIVNSQHHGQGTYRSPDGGIVYQGFNTPFLDLPMLLLE